MMGKCYGKANLITQQAIPPDESKRPDDSDYGLSLSPHETFMTVYITVWTVSYTHLDVYKRQQ